MGNATYLRDRMTTGEQTAAPGRRVWPAWLTVFGLATLPYVELVAANPGELDMIRLSLWWAATVAISLSVVAIAHRWAAAPRAAVLVAVMLYVGFRYDAVAGWLQQLGIGSGSHLLGWLIIALSVLIAAVPLSRRHAVQVFLAVVSVAFLILPGAQAAADSGRGTVAWNASAGSPAFDVPAVTPNIWVLVPDGYSRADVLARRTGLDISPWLDELRARGFQVADQARANYPATWGSLPSMLDMTYLLDGSDTVGDLEPLFDRIRGNNVTVATLRSWGYAYTHAYSGSVWDGARCAGYEDRCIGRSRLTATDRGILRTTPMAPVLDGWAHDQVAALSDPTFVVDEVLSEQPASPHFVMAHLFNPHPPFVRDASCARLDPPAAGMEGYGGMVECLNRQLLMAVDQIVANDPDAVIVIQSDHGRDFGLDWTDPTDPAWTSQAGEDRWPLLAAIRMPGGCEVPPALSPVNTMRLVLACLAGEPADLLPYKSWIAVYDADVVPRH